MIGGTDDDDTVRHHWDVVAADRHAMFRVDEQIALAFRIRVILTALTMRLLDGFGYHVNGEAACCRCCLISWSLLQQQQFHHLPRVSSLTVGCV